MKEIKLTQGKVAIIDDEDFEKVSLLKWCAQHRHNCWYAINHLGKPTFMHRFLMKANGDDVIDHINGNGLDNRKINLRVCSHSENIRNRRKHKLFSSIYKGVYWIKKKGKWCSQIRLDGKKYFLGLFETEYMAAISYDIAAKKMFGEYASLNF